tara:strand:- start:30 stop:518 length:489 start_codon:yes stop_codon:yes gene_type:complete
MININQMRSLIERTCRGLGRKYASKAAVDLVLVTGMVESRYEYLRQMNDGPAFSMHQIEKSTAVDTLVHYLKHRPKLMARCAEVTMVDLKHWQNYDEELWSKILEVNIAAGIVHCRLKYWRVPKRLPSSIEGQANYYKKYYNSDLGKADPEDFIHAAKKWVL